MMATRFGLLFTARKNYYLLINGLPSEIIELEKQRDDIEAQLKKVRFVLPSEITLRGFFGQGIFYFHVQKMVIITFYMRVMQTSLHIYIAVSVTKYLKFNVTHIF